jgi:hypothetical protein
MRWRLTDAPDMPAWMSVDDTSVSCAAGSIQRLSVCASSAKGRGPEGLGSLMRLSLPTYGLLCDAQLLPRIRKVLAFQCTRVYASLGVITSYKSCTRTLLPASGYLGQRVASICRTAQMLMVKLHRRKGLLQAPRAGRRSLRLDQVCAECPDGNGAYRARTEQYPRGPDAARHQRD